MVLTGLRADRSVSSDSRSRTTHNRSYLRFLMISIGTKEQVRCHIYLRITTLDQRYIPIKVLIVAMVGGTCKENN